MLYPVRNAANTIRTVICRIEIIIPVELKYCNLLTDIMETIWELGSRRMLMKVSDSQLEIGIPLLIK
jgi:hypothetical protein